MTSHHQRPVLPVPDAGRSRSQGLPAEILEKASGRLRITAIVTMAVAIFRLVMPFVIGASDAFGTEREVAVKLVFFVVAAVIGAILLVLSYVPMPRPRFMFFGQVFFILLVATFSASESTAEWGPHPFTRGIPMACGVILVFPMIVPMPPRHYLVTALAAVATTPLVQLTVPLLVGHPPASGEIVLLSLMPLLLCLVVAMIAAKVIYQLGRDLGRAQKMGSYQMVALLGKGGMGEVWRAKHGMLAREAAIKLIRQDGLQKGADEAVRRFEHEARVVASLRSQHTIQLYDFGVTDDGALYYAMELLDGMDLDKLVQLHGAIPPERVVHFMIQACDSLSEAHAAGLVHRDIKPANLFATRLGRDVDLLKVLDFGLATRPLAERVDARMTQQGTILGTPAYMAPEQVLGDALIDGRADLYNLGLIAWFLLTARDVFQATTATQVMFAHVNVEPEPPSLHTPQAIPPALEACILRCLAKRREERPVSADALASELGAIALPTPWTRERAQAWWAAHGSGPIAAKSPQTASTAPAAVAETRDSPPIDAGTTRF